MIKLLFLASLSISLFLGARLTAFAQTLNTTPSPTASVSAPTQNTSSVKAMQYLLQASALLYDQKNFTAAANILNAIDVSSLPPDLEQRYVLQQATLALTANDSAKATIWLNKPILTEVPINDIEKQISFHELRAKVFLLKTQFLDSAKEYLLLLKITPKLNEQLYVNALWDSLSKMDAAALTNTHTEKTSSDLYEWAELALILKDTSIGKEDQQVAVKKWFAVHPNHPVPSLLIQLNTTSQPSKP